MARERGGGEGENEENIEGKQGRVMFLIKFALIVALIPSSLNIHIHTIVNINFGFACTTRENATSKQIKSEIILYLAEMHVGHFRIVQSH